MAFWEDMVAAWEEKVGTYNLYWPLKAPTITAGEVKSYFEEEGFARGLKFVKLIIRRMGSDFELSHAPLNLPNIGPDP